MTENSGGNKLMQAFFSPAVFLMNRLDITRKFLLLGLMSLAAVVVVVYSLFVSLDRVIISSQRELEGLELVRQFPKVMQILQEHRGLSALVIGGSDAMRDARAKAKMEADRALNGMLGESFSGTPASEDLQHIRIGWERLRIDGLDLTAAENFAAHTRLIDQIQTFEGIIADDYALTLDPELSTFYLFDTIVNKLPHALEHLCKLRAYGAGILARRQITAQQHLEMNTLMTELDDAIALLNINLGKTGRYNPALQGLISSASTDITASAQQITGLVRSDILTSRFAVSPDDFFGMSTAIIDRGYVQLQEALLPAAETLIKARIAHAEDTLRTSVGIAFLLFLVVAYFSIGIARTVIANIRSIARSAHAFADGDLSERIGLNTRDELGQVGDSFNEMATVADALLKASHENELRLRDLLAHLEERVRERTAELEQTQRETELLLRRNQALMLTSMDGIHVMDMQGNLLSANDAFCQMLGYTQQDISGLNVAEWEVQWPIDELLEKFRKLIGKSAMFETVNRRKDGTLINVEVSAAGVELEGESFIYASNRDITGRKKADEDLRIAAAAFETNEAIMITDADANIIRVNRAFTEITGYTPEEVLGMNPHIMSSGRHDKTFYDEMWQQLARSGTWSGEIWDKRKDGQIYPKWMTVTAVKNERQENAQYVAIFSDITARKRAEEEIRNMAFYDVLTKLPNRRLFLDRFGATLAASVRHNKFGAVLFIDLDHFKQLNDTLGHEYGDMLLIEVAARIKSCVREVDTVARLGGDEFVVLVEEVSEDQDEASHKVGLVAEKIREVLTHPYQLKEHEHRGSSSIGISLYRGNHEAVEALLQHADTAMYQAKSSGRNEVRFFDTAMQHNVAMHAELVNDLRRAIEQQQLRLYYQIQVGDDNRPLGAEALLRWIHPQRGMIMPGQFIPIAEESSLIIEIDDWVLEMACRQLALWSGNAQTRDLLLTVNVSAKQFAMRDFVDKVAGRLKAHQVNPARLKLELTERMVLDDLAGTVKKMHALKALGVSLSMDDFGTRYSSLSYLKQLPIDQLKIDKGFVQAITNGSDDALLVKNIIGLMSDFNMSVIAEGVETEAQLASLKQRDCISYQGYLFGEAVPIEDFEKSLGLE